MAIGTRIQLLALLPVLLPLLRINAFTSLGLGGVRRNTNLRRQRTSTVCMKLDITGGSYVAIVTPLTEKGDVDMPALRSLLRWHVECGTDGIVTLGTTGEAAMMSAEERTSIIKLTIEEVGGKIPVVVGTGGTNPVTVIRHSKEAAELGADGCLVVTPYYVKPTQAGLVKFFTTVADAVPLPMIMYNVPGRTGVDMSIQTTLECAKHPTIVGLKDATGDLQRVKPVLEGVDSSFLLYSGDDETGCELMIMGGHGVISVTADIAPAAMAKMSALATTGKAEEAREINSKLKLLHKKLFLQSNPIPTKHALWRMGRCPTPNMRLPLLPLEEQFHAQIDEALRAGGCL